MRGYYVADVRGGIVDSPFGLLVYPAGVFFRSTVFPPSFYRFFRIFKNLIYVHIGRFLGNRTKSYRCFTVGFTVLIVDSAEQGMFGLTVLI